VTQFGTNFQPLGSVKIKLIQILGGLIKIGSRRINKGIVEHKIIIKIMVISKEKRRPNGFCIGIAADFPME